MHTILLCIYIHKCPSMRLPMMHADVGDVYQSGSAIHAWHTYIHTYIHTCTRIHIRTHIQCVPTRWRNTCVSWMPSCQHFLRTLQVHRTSSSLTVRSNWQRRGSEVCVCVCVCVCLYVFVCARVSVHTCGHNVSVHVYCIHTCMHACMHAWVHAHAHAHTNAHMHTYAHTHVHVTHAHAEFTRILHTHTMHCIYTHKTTRARTSHRTVT